MAKILIPDYLGQQVLAGARALQGQGDSCTMAWQQPTRLEKWFRSRAIDNVLIITPSHINSLQYIDDLIDIVSEQSYDVLMPFGLSSYYAIARYADKLSPYTRFMVSDFAAFEIANDKLMTAQHAKKIGLAIPEVYSDYEESDIQSIASSVRFPVVIKARTGSGVKDRIYYAENQSQLLRYYQKIYQHQDRKTGFEWKPPLIQEYIPGYVHDACALAVNGDAKTVLTQKRKVMYPISGGVGAINLTTHDPRLVELCQTLLESLKWHGPAQVEFKYDSRDSRYKLIEINPKFWGTLDLSIKSGVNFPLLIRNYLAEGITPTSIRYEANLEYKFYFPQYVLAKMQLMMAGERFNQQNPPVLKSWRDFQWRDCKPDLLRGAGAMMALIRQDWRQNNK